MIKLVRLPKLVKNVLINKQRNLSKQSLHFEKKELSEDFFKIILSV